MQVSWRHLEAVWKLEAKVFVLLGQPDGEFNALPPVPIGENVE